MKYNKPKLEVVEIKLLDIIKTSDENGTITGEIVGDNPKPEPGDF